MKALPNSRPDAPFIPAPTKVTHQMERAAFELFCSQRFEEGSAFATRPFPVAVESSGLAAFNDQLLDSWRSLIAEQAVPQLVPLKTDVIRPIVDWCLTLPAFRTLQSAEEISRVEINTSITVAVFHHIFRAREGCILRTTASLDAMLSDSDISSDMPITMLKAPFPTCYVHLANPIDVLGAQEVGDQSLLSSTQSLKAIGAYILSRDVDRSGSNRPGDEAALTLIDFLFLLEHRAKGESPTYLAMPTMIGYKDSDHFSLGEEITTRLEANDSPSMVANLVKSTVLHIAKVLLYTGLSQARLHPQLDLTDAQSGAAGRGVKKLAKAQHRLSRLYDHIVVGPITAYGGGGSHFSQGEKRPHMRRGHFRLQHYGPKLSLNKMTFIAPVLVRADRANGEAIAPKNYVLT